VSDSPATIDSRFLGDGLVARRVSGAIGHRRLRQMARAGLPASLHGPLRLLLDRTIDAKERALVDRVEALRAALAAGPGDVGVFDAAVAAGRALPAAPRPDERRPDRRPLAEVAHVTSIPAMWGMFLHRCACDAGARTILELGTGAGISGCYLGSAPGCRRFVTVEGSPERARVAEGLLRQVVPHADLRVAAFDAALDALLPTLAEGLDLAFVDGNKTRGGYLDVVRRLAPHLARGALLVFDDIQWTELRDDWRALSAMPGIAWAINTGRFGVCVWEGGEVTPQAVALFGLGGVDLYQVRRDLLARISAKR
jgi:predicted O-methyltransferase YrrM